MIIMIMIIIIIISSSSSNSNSNGTSINIFVFIIIMFSSTASLVMIISSISIVITCWSLVLLSLPSLVVMLGLTRSLLTFSLLNSSFSLLFGFGLKLLITVFKISRFSNPDPRVEILKHIAYGNQGARFFESRP